MLQLNTVQHLKHCTKQKAVKSDSWKESEFRGRAVKGFTLLVQLSCGSKHYKEKWRENRGEDITACQVDIHFLRSEGQVVHGKRKAKEKERTIKK